MLHALPKNDVSSEINLLRVLLARTFAGSAQAAASPDPPVRTRAALKAQVSSLTAFSSTAIVLAGLVRLQKRTHSPVDEIRRQIEEGKNQAREELGVFNYLRSGA